MRPQGRAGAWRAGRAARHRAADCIVVEDSITGVHAAVAAGAVVLGFTGGPHSPPDQAERLREAGARLVFGSMAELPGLVEGLRRQS